MTGVGALFELYSSFAEKKDKKKEDVKLEPEGEEEVEGFYDEDSEWHYVIENRDWDALLDLIQHYDFQKFKPKGPEKKPRRLRVVKAYQWARDKVRPPVEPEPDPISPLLAMNEAGETPLHLAIKHLAPDKYIIRMIFCEKRAALVADEEGRLPLHVACISERNTPVIDRCIRANFHHMQQEDNEGRTPLWHSVEQAKFLCEEEGYWGIPRNAEDTAWQEHQEVIWAKVRFILLSYSTRRKIMVESEREIILKCLEYGAPPAVVEVAILAAQGMLKQDPTLASCALKLFMKKEYPIKNLQLLLHHFPVEKVESLEAARKILSDKYYQGNVTPEGREMSFRSEMEKHALDDSFKRSLPCREWFDKIRCLLRLCGHGNNKELKKEFENKHLLHAALSNSDTPPSLVQLLMVISPESIRLKHPFKKALLIHLICGTWKYNLFPQSKGINVVTEMEEPPMEQVLKIILASDASLARKRYKKRLPLHLAVSSHKSLDFLEALLNVDSKALSARDPKTKLYPFQMAAIGGSNRNTALWAHAKYSPDEWKHLEPEERAAAVDGVRDEQDRDQLSSIFLLLRKFPAAVASGALLRKPATFRDTKGKGMVAAHYLGMLYSQSVEDDYVLVDEKYDLIQRAIETGAMPEELQGWFEKMKFWIRYCYPGTENLPEEEDFLLHAAVANSDTPPLVIKLLCAMYPDSPSIPVNGEVLFPLHIACATENYKPQYYEMADVPDVLETLVTANPAAINIQSGGKTPMEIAKANGKSDEETLVLTEECMFMLMAEAQAEEEEEEEIDLSGDQPSKTVNVETGSQGELSEMTEQTPTTAGQTTAASSKK